MALSSRSHPTHRTQSEVISDVYIVLYISSCAVGFQCDKCADSTTPPKLDQASMERSDIESRARQPAGEHFQPATVTRPGLTVYIYDAIHRDLPMGYRN